jgi:rRNA maturation RNase YbeY
MNGAAGKGPITFNFLVNNFTLPNRNILKEFIRSIFRKYNKKFKSVEVIFCSDEYLLEMNRQFLQHDYLTDIITFNLAAGNQPIEAELYISVDRVKDNAGLLGESFQHELHRILFHGILHLCGLNDKTEQDILKMRAAETTLLHQYF